MHDLIPEEINGASIIHEGRFISYVDNTLTIAQGIKLSDVLDRMPYGRIDKRIPGIGATTLELKSQRNSIIVEPLKAIASTKAVEFNALYVGGETKIAPSPSNNEILKYLSSENVIYKKVLVVADSLPRVISMLQYSKQSFDDYFIMIDEIDSYQSDSTFRDSLEKAIDFYLMFDPENRCMISATLKEFTNPELAKEKLTVITYPEIAKRIVNTINAKNVERTTAEIIRILLINQRPKKVLVAYNSINGALKIIDYLEDELTKYCSIICSDYSEMEAGNYFGGIEKGGLPNLINFVTSAYFTGIDIFDNFHLISVVDTRKPHTVLSAEKFIQIHGRARNGVLDDYIIYNHLEGGEKDLDEYKKLLFNRAENFLGAMKCVERAYNYDKKLIKQMDDVRKLIIDDSEFEDSRLTRINKDGESKISYFNIDALLDIRKTKNKLYSHELSLAMELTKSNINTAIHIDPFKYKDKLNPSEGDAQKNNEKKVSSEARSRKTILIKKALEEIQSSDDETYIMGLLKNANSHQKKIYKVYLDWCNNIDRANLINILKECFLDIRDNRKLKYYQLSMRFETLKEDHPFKVAVYKEFEIGKFYTTSQIKNKINKIFSDIKVGIPPKQTEVNAIRNLNSFLKTIKAKGEYRIDGKSTFKIAGKNPKGIKRIKPFDITKDGKSIFSF